MARPRKKKVSGNHFAWSEIRNGGEVETLNLPNKTTRTVITKRNVVMPGEAVSQESLGVSDEDWEALIAGGSVRPYEYPEDASGYISPNRAVMLRYLNSRGEIDEATLVDLALTQPLPVMNPPAEEGKEVPAGA